MKTSILPFLLCVIAPAAYAQDLSRASTLTFEYPATRTVSGGQAASYSSVANPAEMLAILAAAIRLNLYSAVSFAAAVEGETNIDGVAYRLFFPRVPPREAPYVFAAARAESPTNRTYFVIPPERYTEFARLYRSVLNRHRDEPSLP